MIFIVAGGPKAHDNSLENRLSLSPLGERVWSFYIYEDSFRIPALSLGERVDRDSAFTGCRGTGEGSFQLIERLLHPTK